MVERESRAMPPACMPPRKATFMSDYSLSHLKDHDLDRDLPTAMAAEHGASAVPLACIAEFAARRRYLPAGYPSMHAYCVQRLNLSEHGAYKRIRAARAAREFPAIFHAVAESRLHLSGICLLAPHLMPGNVDELLKAATHRTMLQIEELLAARFPHTETLPLVQRIPASSARDGDELATRRVAPPGTGPVESSACELAPGQVRPISRTKGQPVSADSFLHQVTFSRRAEEKLRYARELLSYRVLSGDVAEVLERGLDALIVKLEKRRFAATAKPRTIRRRGGSGTRHIP